MRKKIKQLLTSKNIVLFGVTDNAIEFCEQYRAVLNVRACVTHSGDIVESQPMRKYGLETFLFDDYDFTSDDYVVICEYQRYGVFDESLRTNKFVEYIDYVNSKLARCILEDKKLAVFMGTSFINQIKRGLQIQPEVEKTYLCEYYSEDEILHIYKNNLVEYRHLAKMCDIHVVSVCDKDMYDAKVLEEGFLVDECLNIRVSDYMFNGYFPQINGDRDSYSNFLYRERERMARPYGTLALAREDSNLVALVKKNMPINEIIQKVSDKEYYTKEFIADFFEKALQNIRLADEKADIKIADFIEKKCKRKVAYRNLDECCIDVVRYAIEKIADRMEVRLESVDEEKLKEQLERMSGSELPIYPCVLKGLDIEGYDDKKYRVVTYYNERYMNFEEYIRYCVEFMYQIKEISSFLGIGNELGMEE